MNVSAFVSVYLFKSVMSNSTFWDTSSRQSFGDRFRELLREAEAAGEYNPKPLFPHKVWAPSQAALELATKKLAKAIKNSNFSKSFWKGGPFLRKVSPTGVSSRYIIGGSKRKPRFRRRFRYGRRYKK